MSADGSADIGPWPWLCLARRMRERTDETVSSAPGATLADSVAGGRGFFCNPANLPLITPPDLGFRITSPLPELMYAGMIVCYSVTPFGWLPVTWVTEITHATEPHFFVDELRLGSYRFWHH